MAPVRIAVVGLGKIARDQHLPAIAASESLILAATVDPHGAGTSEAPHFPDLEALLMSATGIDALAICTPPQLRARIALDALARGIAVLLEKPPAAELAEADALERAAAATRATLFASWHSRFAGAVSPARAWLAERTIVSVTITWREDVRVWHPCQKWIWQPGGLGVFDPGINALSIATAILPRPLSLVRATLDVPGNCATPIAARLALADSEGAPVAVDLDFLQSGKQTWDIVIETDAGTLALREGGSVLALPEGEHRYPDAEYPALYAHFAELVREGRSDFDLAPFRLVADALRIGRCEHVADFIE